MKTVTTQVKQETELEQTLWMLLNNNNKKNVIGVKEI